MNTWLFVRRIWKWNNTGNDRCARFSTLRDSRGYWSRTCGESDTGLQAKESERLRICHTDPQPITESTWTKNGKNKISERKADQPKYLSNLSSYKREHTLCGLRLACSFDDGSSDTLQTAKEHQAPQAAEMLYLTQPFHSLCCFLGLPAHGALYFLSKLCSRNT